MVLKHPWDFSNMKLIGVRCHFVPPEDDKKNKRSGDEENEENEENEEEYSDGYEAFEEFESEERHLQHSRRRKRKDIREHNHAGLKKRGRPPKSSRPLQQDKAF